MTISCLLCRGERGRFLFEKEGHPFVRCRSCGCVFVSSGRTVPEMKGVYDRWGDAIYTDGDYLEHAGGREFRDIFAGLEERVAVGRLLEVGCNTGAFLVAARRRGWETAGVEISTPAANRARHAHGLDVCDGTLADADYADGSFDAVCYVQTLEHVLRPLEELELARRKLRPGGLLYVSVPSWDSLERRVYRRRWRMVSSSHITYFTHATLRRALRAAGLDPLLVRSTYFNPCDFARHVVQPGAATVEIARQDARIEKEVRRKPYFGLLRLGYRGLCRVLFRAGLGSVLEAYAVSPGRG